MVLGMATRKITITLRDDQIEEVRALVAAGQAASVSAFVRHADSPRVAAARFANRARQSR